MILRACKMSHRVAVFCCCCLFVVDLSSVDITRVYLFALILGPAILSFQPAIQNFLVLPCSLGLVQSFPLYFHGVLKTGCRFLLFFLKKLPEIEVCPRSNSVAQLAEWLSGDAWCSSAQDVTGPTPSPAVWGPSWFFPNQQVQAWNSQKSPALNHEWYQSWNNPVAFSKTIIAGRICLCLHGN